jgi:hypothetical protein
MFRHEAVAELHLEFAQLLQPYAPNGGCEISLGFPPVESNTLECSNALLCHETRLSSLRQLILSALIRNPILELVVGRIMFRHEAVAELHLEFAQLLKPYAPNGGCEISLGFPPVESNTLELSNALFCHGTWLSCLMQPVSVALSQNPPPKFGDGRRMFRHEVAAQYLVLAQLLKAYAPNGCSISLGCPPAEFNTLELSNVLLCHGTWLSLLMQPVSVALSQNPPPKFGDGRRMFRHEAVTAQYLVLAQLLKAYAPNGCSISLGCPPAEFNTLELSNVLLCHGTWLSLLKQLILSALSRNPPPELGVCRKLFRHEAVTGLYLVFAQLL